MTGMEIELNLVGPDHRPMMENAEVLRQIADNDFQTGWAGSISSSMSPRRLPGRLRCASNRDLRASLNHAQEASAGSAPALSARSASSPRSCPSTSPVSG